MTHQSYEVKSRTQPRSQEFHNGRSVVVVVVDPLVTLRFITRDGTGHLSL